MVEWLATILTLVGVILNIKKIRYGFLVWLVANILWAYIQYQVGIYGMFICQIVFCFTCIWGWVEWSKKLNENI